jgi:hypothetical protein
LEFHDPEDDAIPVAYKSLLKTPKVVEFGKV